MMVRSEAELKLQEMLKVLRPARASWRGQVFCLSQIDSASEAQTLEKIVCSVVNDAIADKEGSTYITHDHDVILLCTSVTKKQLDDIEAEVSRHIPDKLRGVLSGFSYSFDLGIAFEDICAYANKKSELYKAKLETHGTAEKTLYSKTSIQNTSANTHVGKNSSPDILAVRIARKQTRVLLVEDDTMSLHLARKTLMPEYEVFAATSGMDAQAAYVLHAPDVVFLDIGLPDITGHAVLKNILKCDPTAYVVMLSGNSTREDILKAMHTGAKGFVGKPFSKAKLHQYISQCPTHHGSTMLQSF